MVATLDESTTHFQIEILSASQLLDSSRRKLLRSLCRLINDAFSAHGHPKDNGDEKPDALFVRKRLIYDEELPESLGPEAMLAVCTDQMKSISELEDGSQLDPSLSSVSSNVVATASLMPWKGKAIDIVRSAQEALATQRPTPTDSQATEVVKHEVTQLGELLAKDSEAKLSDSWNWEVKLCASSEDPQYRGRGLITRCLDVLLADVRSRQAAMRSAGDPRGDLAIKLWSTTLEGTGNTEYWVRRGFTRAGEADLAPSGMWTSKKEIRIATLWKTLE